VATRADKIDTQSLAGSLQIQGALLQIQRALSQERLDCGICSVRPSLPGSNALPLVLYHLGDGSWVHPRLQRTEPIIRRGVHQEVQHP
jgi:hypothetical protein